RKDSSSWRLPGVAVGKSGDVFQADDEGSIPFTRSTDCAGAADASRGSAAASHVGVQRCWKASKSFLFNAWRGADLIAMVRATARGLRGKKAHGEAEIRTDEAALQCRDDRSRGPRQDDVDGCADEGFV